MTAFMRIFAFAVGCIVIALFLLGFVGAIEFRVYIGPAMQPSPARVVLTHSHAARLQAQHHHEGRA